MTAVTAGRLGRWARTLAHVTPSQVLARGRIVAWRRLISALPWICSWRAAQADFAPDLQVEAVLGLLAVIDRFHPDPMLAADAVCERRFTYLNVERQFGDRVDWSPPDAELLWTYHLHYAEWARSLALAFVRTRNTKYYQAFRDLCCDWIAANLPGRSIGWWPFPVAVRLFNWSLAAAAFAEPLGDDEVFRTELRVTLREQGWFMVHGLETDVGGNHLIKDLKGLIGAGTCLGGPTGKKWVGRATRGLEKEMGKQILEDGGHYERSPYYHSMVLQDLKELAVLPGLASTEAPWLHQSIARMERWLFGVLHPDGDVPFFNDSQLLGEGMMRGLCEGAALTEEEPTFPETGLYVIKQGPLWAVAKVGQPYPAQLPAHAHCDLLSYEYSWAGLRFIVNAGTYTYQGELRQSFRSTSAHNTGQVMEREQSEVWGQFRVGGRVRFVQARSVRTVKQTTVYGAYRVAPGRAKDPLHERWMIRTGTSFTVHDVFTVEPGSTAVIRMLVHPAVAVRRESPGLWKLTRQGHSIFLRTSGRGDLGESWWSPQFGEKIATRQLVMPADEIRPGRLVASHRIGVDPDGGLGTAPPEGAGDTLGVPGGDPM